MSFMLLCAWPMRLPVALPFFFPEERLNLLVLCFARNCNVMLPFVLLFFLLALRRACVVRGRAEYR